MNDNLVWTKKKVWGVQGFTHMATIIIDGADYKFVIDQPVKGEWVTRGWKNGVFFCYRDRDTASTLSEMKVFVTDLVDWIRTDAKDGQK